eukprot:Skav225345  [mRNA]  locus=scaffold3721:81094:82044:- [translate_table: standard]
MVLELSSLRYSAANVQASQVPMPRKLLAYDGLLEAMRSRRHRLCKAMQSVSFGNSSCVSSSRESNITQQ